MAEQLALDFEGPALSPDQRAVYALLRRGRGNAIRRVEISRLTGLGDVAVRTAVKELIEECSILICSATGSPAGYYLPETLDEHGQGTAQIIHRITSLARRLRAMNRPVYEQFFGGACLPLEGGKSDIGYRKSEG